MFFEGINQFSVDKKQGDGEKKRSNFCIGQIKAADDAYKQCFFERMEKAIGRGNKKKNEG